jgi:hypothetical protein
MLTTIIIIIRHVDCFQHDRLSPNFSMGECLFLRMLRLMTDLYNNVNDNPIVHVVVSIQVLSWLARR